MPRNLVLFDLEWNIGYQPYTFNSVSYTHLTLPTIA